MTTPAVQVWILNSAYAKVAYLKRWRSVTYTQNLNAASSCTIEMHPDDSAIADCDIVSSGTQRIRRVQIIRDGVTVFAGLVERCDWTLPQAAPKGETWAMQAVGGEKYLDWRIVVPASGQSHDSRTGTADDVMKAYVRYHAGSSAGTGRPFTDLTVQADSTAGPAYSAEERYEVLRTVVDKIAAKGKVYWRMKPAATGFTFETGYPLYGLDRTKGNGVNDECVFSLDRANFITSTWVLDRLALANYVYVAGQGQEELRTVVERSDATSITQMLRRELFLDARNLSLTASLQNRGDAELTARAPIEEMAVQPKAGTWKATTGTTWDIGDKVTIYLRPDYGGSWRAFTANAVITGVSVTLSAPPEPVETAQPVLEVVA